MASANFFLGVRKVDPGSMVRSGKGAGKDGQRRENVNVQIALSFKADRSVSYVWIT
jgi:hypothetical protein